VIARATTGTMTVMVRRDAVRVRKLWLPPMMTARSEKTPKGAEVHDNGIQ
jgi:hypothetical protein